MAIDQATVRKIASLARIAISDAEAAAMEGELNGILGWVEQLGEVDVTGVEPMTAVIPNKLRLRDDIVDADPLTGGNRRDDILANADPFTFLAAQYKHGSVLRVVEFREVRYFRVLHI